MFAFTEQVTTAVKASLSSQYESLASLGSKAFDNVEQVVDLNLSLMRATLEQSTETVRQLIEAKDAQQFIAVSSAQLKPQGEKFVAYGRHLADLATNARHEISEVTEARVVEGNRKMIGLIETVAKNAPAGSAPAVALFKSALGNANTGYEQLSKTTRQAVEALEVNLAAVVSGFADPGAKGGRRAHK